MVNVKICLLGDGTVGKTTIKRSFIGLPITIDYAATIGADFSIKDHKFKALNEEFSIRYLIYDLAGQPRYTAIRRQYMTGAHAAIVMYDVSNRNSFNNVLNWLVEFKKVIKEDVPLVLVGNKIDLREDSSHQELKQVKTETQPQSQQSQKEMQKPGQGYLGDQEKVDAIVQKYRDSIAKRELERKKLVATSTRMPNSLSASKPNPKDSTNKISMTGEKDTSNQTNLHSQTEKISPDHEYITTQEGEKLLTLIKEKYSNKDKNNIFFIETSAKENVKVDEAFDYVSNFVYNKYMRDNPFA